MSVRADVGLQPERTELSWRRTVLSSTAVGLVIVRAAVVENGVGLLAGSAVVLAAAGTLWLLARRRTRQMRNVFDSPVRGAPLPGGALLLVLGVLTASGAAAAMIHAFVAAR